jgi:hypothetical protein
VWIRNLRALAAPMCGHARPEAISAGLPVANTRPQMLKSLNVACTAPEIYMAVATRVLTSVEGSYEPEGP